MPYKREVLLKLDGSNEEDAEIIQAFYLDAGMRAILDHLIHLAADKRVKVEDAWNCVAHRLGKEDVGALGHVIFDHLSGEVYRKVWVEEPRAEPTT